MTNDRRIAILAMITLRQVCRCEDADTRKIVSDYADDAHVFAEQWWHPRTVRSVVKDA